MKKLQNYSIELLAEKIAAELEWNPYSAVLNDKEIEFKEGIAFITGEFTAFRDNISEAPFDGEIESIEALLDEVVLSFEENESYNLTFRELLKLEKLIEKQF